MCLTIRTMTSASSKRKISIITVCYNACKVIEKTIESVLAQSYPDKEYIIIDGGSTDGTVDIIKKYSDKISYWVSEPDKGIYDAMNKGIDAATGDWINFMNAGDTFVEDRTLELVADRIESTQSADIVYGDTIKAYKYGKKECKPLQLRLMARHIVFCHQSSFVRTELMKKDKFSLKYKIAGDYDFFYRQYTANRAFAYIPIPVAVYDAESGISSTQYMKLYKENAEISGRDGSALWRFQCAMVQVKALLKKILPGQLVLNKKQVKQEKS